MAAGLGFKTFTTGEVLTAADTNGYLMQGINVFATTAARDAAITAPAEGQFAFTKDTNGLWYYDGAAWVASGATGDIEGVTAGIGISGGGTSGTVTVTNSMATAIDAKGDLVAGTGADAFSRLAVGTNNTVLTADSAEATGLKWATASAALDIAQIATGTLSGSGVSLTGLSSYDTLELRISGANVNANDQGIRLYCNADNTGTNWEFAVVSTGARTAYNAADFDGYRSTGIGKFEITQNLGLMTANTTNSFFMRLTNCKSVGMTFVDYWANYRFSAGGVATNASASGTAIWKTEAAIASLQWNSPTQTFSAGTYTLWGA